MSKRAVLLIVNEGPSGTTLEMSLQQAGWTVSATASGDDAIERAALLKPAVVLLDEHLPNADALEVCDRIRSRFPDPEHPVFLLVPNGNFRNREAGENSERLNTVELPDAGQLAECINTLIGRAEDFEPYGIIRCQGLVIDRQRHAAMIDNRELNFTLTEFRIIWALAEKPGYVVSREQLAASCQRDDGPVQQRTVDVHIKSIRQKLLDRSDLIETVRGVGYRLREAHGVRQSAG